LVFGMRAGKQQEQEQKKQEVGTHTIYRNICQRIWRTSP
jgi:hypothetical protein